MSKEEKEEVAYVQANCKEGHPMILKAYCRMCEEEKTESLYYKMLALFKEMKTQHKTE